MTLKKHSPRLGALEILKYIGPGLLVTVGFIDPGNWASNLSAGADFGYALLWVVSLSTVMLIILQHNVAHLGIVTGFCLSEATSLHVKAPYSTLILSSVMVASISTSLAEILGASIALNMIFAIPVPVAAALVTIFVVVMLFTNTYKAVEKGIVALVSIIGLSFLYELSLTTVEWDQVFVSWV
ncbi:MAG TPA: Nramp family divalent metal transporter, partial [Candidatus Latescibacteria bacterium]|nr:Nramp family divalent metal transporter [Candidatus Latescibacterota bacterium]